MAGKKKCATGDGEEARSKGLCGNHYVKARRLGLKPNKDGEWSEKDLNTLKTDQRGGGKGSSPAAKTPSVPAAKRGGGRKARDTSNDVIAGSLVAAMMFAICEKLQIDVSKLTPVEASAQSASEPAKPRTEFEGLSEGAVGALVVAGYKGGVPEVAALPLSAVSEKLKKSVIKELKAEMKLRGMKFAVEPPEGAAPAQEVVEIDGRPKADSNGAAAAA